MAKLIFQLPEGVEIPDGKKMGDTFQAMATFKIMDKGMGELTQVDGESIDGSSQDNEDEAEPQDDSQASAIPGMFGSGQ